jgi:sugar lactone lactonase YvrE
MKSLVAVFILTGLCALPAFAADRVDLFDQQGRRTGYAIVDRESGRVDYYDAQSRHTGWGKVDPAGRAERFDLHGRRQESTVLPLERTDPKQR